MMKKKTEKVYSGELASEILFIIISMLDIKKNIYI